MAFKRTFNLKKKKNTFQVMTDLLINNDSKIMFLRALAGNRTRASRVAGENSTTEPPVRHICKDSPKQCKTLRRCFKKMTFVEATYIRETALSTLVQWRSAQTKSSHYTIIMQSQSALTMASLFFSSLLNPPVAIELIARFCAHMSAPCGMGRSATERTMP